MPKLTLRPHDWKRNKKGNSILVRTSAYVRLHQSGEPAIFVQGGRYFTDGGEEVMKAPPWVLEQIKTLTDTVKKEVGLVGSVSDDLPRTGDDKG